MATLDPIHPIGLAGASHAHVAQGKFLKASEQGSAATPSRIPM